MTPSRTALSTALLLAAHGWAAAQSQPIQQGVPQVRISASALEQRAQSTTTAIVVSREEILRQGDSNLTDVLKRQPGITIDGAPGKAAIRMRGLGAGYVAM